MQNTIVYLPVGQLMGWPGRVAGPVDQAGSRRDLRRSRHRREQARAKHDRGNQWISQ